ncbi:hypothetical protein Tco_0019734 [Tanacetum coccineum]
MRIEGVCIGKATLETKASLLEPNGEPKEVFGKAKPRGGSEFSTSGEAQMTIEDVKAQMKEIKRLTALKLKKEKTEKRLKKVMTLDEIKAQAEELAAYEAKREKMLKEYNHCINFRADPLPITKISYRVNNSMKEACMRIKRNNKPLNLILYDKFVLKMLGFSEWLEVLMSTWMEFGGNTRDLVSFGEETDEITDLHQILEEVLLTERRDGVASIKRRRRNLFSDGVLNLETASGRGRLKEDLESST